MKLSDGTSWLNAKACKDGDVIEFLNEGELYVTRPDAKMLLSIKHGEWTLEWIKTEANRLFKRIEEIYDRCKLPSKPDIDAINQLCVDVCGLALECIY